MMFGYMVIGSGTGQSNGMQLNQLTQKIELSRLSLRITVMATEQGSGSMPSTS